MLCDFWLRDLEKKDTACKKNPMLESTGDSHKQDNKPVYKTTKGKWFSNKSNKNLELLHYVSGLPIQVSLKDAFWAMTYESLIHNGVIGILNDFATHPQFPIQLGC